MAKTKLTIELRRDILNGIAPRIGQTEKLQGVIAARKQLVELLFDWLQGHALKPADEEMAKRHNLQVNEIALIKLDPDVRWEEEDLDAIYGARRHAIERATLRAPMPVSGIHEVGRSQHSLKHHKGYDIR